jgi:hypothetical protein
MFILASFSICENKYAIQRDYLSYDFFELKPGDVRPSDALDVWEFKLRDTSFMADAKGYEYRLIFNDCTLLSSTDKDPVFCIIGDVGKGETFRLFDRAKDKDKR